MARSLCFKVAKWPGCRRAGAPSAPAWRFVLKSSCSNYLHLHVKLGLVSQAQAGEQQAPAVADARAAPLTAEPADSSHNIYAIIIGVVRAIVVLSRIVAKVAGENTPHKASQRATRIGPVGPEN
eukprot:scaffold21903_cov116-Isochrysis_galbana.AAC.2